MLWIEKFSGDTRVWYNGGRGSPDTGGRYSFYWRVQEKKAYYGLVSGSCIYYADLDGNDHVDEHYILESFNNKGRTSLNPSCGLTHRTGDEGSITNPNLPVQPGPDEDDNTGGGSGGDHTPYVPNPKDDNPLPTSPDASKYTTIDGSKYRIDRLLILQDSLARYDEIMASGYDKYFKIYADYLVSNAWSALRNFMFKHGDEYFTCKITEDTTCCNVCKAEGVSCQWCRDSCDIQGPYDDLCRCTNTTQLCPPNYSQRGMNSNDENTIYWSLRSDKESDFWDAAAAEVGAPREKMNIAKLQLIGTLDLSCSRDAVYNGVEHIIASCYYRYFWFDAPQVEGFITNGVTNPKTILNKALGDPSVPFWNFVQRQGYPRHQ
ncbi:unnamed protein product [Colletotrichum noveboracense]|uniref:Uncharacterized protein n=1 Tax=Colletotrichum noveboracense TaxID=2664923 RepID=A0A9W4WDS3_9PEZI|nr:unnamed protein product [Colletotrichum noveboracense]